MATVVLEESLKYKDGRKWKTRWGVLRRLSPVADPRDSQNALPDQLHISFFKDANDQKKNHPEKSNIALQDFYGIESGFNLDKEHHVIAIICQKHVAILAFQSRQSLMKWEVAIRSHLGEEKQFAGKILQAPPQSKFPLGSSRIFVLGEKLCVTTNRPPRILGTWHVTDLRKFGAQNNKFGFEAGSRCGRYAGLFVFNVDQPKQVENTLKQASQKNLSRSRPSLRSGLSSDSPRHYASSAGISGTFDPPLPSPSYSTYTTNYADLSLVNEEEEEEEEGPEVTFLSSDDAQPSVRYSDVSRVQVVDVHGNASLSQAWGDRSVPAHRPPHVPSGKPPGKDYVEYADLRLGTESGGRRFSSSDIQVPDVQYQSVTSAPPEAVYTAGGNISRSVQRNIDALAPKLSHCANNEDPRSTTLPAPSRKSGYMVESHGQPRSVANSVGGSLDLSDAILKVCHADEFANTIKSSSNSSSSSTRDLAENTPSLSCKIGQRSSEDAAVDLTKNVIRCNVCQRVLVREDYTLSSPCECVMMAYGGRDTQQCRSDSREQRIAQPSLIRCQTEPVLRGAHTQPLQPVNFSRYDGYEDGEYLYWMKGIRSDRPQLPEFSHPAEHTDSSRKGGVVHGGRSSAPAVAVAAKLMHDPQYVNIPSDSELEVKKSKQKRKPWSKLMSIHDSLRRTKSKGSPKQAESMYAGSYVTLRTDGGDAVQQARAKGKSLEDVLSSGSEDTARALAGLQTSLPGTPTRNRRSGKRMPPPFEPAPAIPVKSGDSGARPSETHSSVDHIYAVPHVCQTGAPAVSDQMPKPVRPYANQNLLARPVPARRQTVCSSDFHNRKQQAAGHMANDTVFCNVQLPYRAAHQSNAQREHVQPTNFNSTNEESAYLRMNVGTGMQELNTSLGRSSSVHEGSNRLRPRLHHSRSLDNELDSDSCSYLEMNLGNGNGNGAPAGAAAAAHRLPHTSVILEDNSSSYMPMAPGGPAHAHGRAPHQPSAPFENLIEHHHHSAKQPVTNVRTHARISEEKGSADDETEKSTKTPGLLSRFIRRNSSNKDLKDKDKKSSKHEENQGNSISTVPEITSSVVPDVKLAGGATSAVVYHRDSDPDIHEHVPLSSGYRSRSNSSHVPDTAARRLGPLPERQHSYTYLDVAHLDVEPAGLAGQQGDSYSSLLDLPPAPPPPIPYRTADNQPAGGDNIPTAGGVRAPQLPPKTYREEAETYMEMNLSGTSRPQTGGAEVESNRPKLPTPEPDGNSQNAASGKEATPPPTLPGKTGAAQPNTNPHFTEMSEESPLMAIAPAPSEPAAATAVYYNEPGPTFLSARKHAKAPNLRVDVPPSISATTQEGRVVWRSDSGRRPSLAGEEEDVWMVRDSPVALVESRRGTMSSSHAFSMVQSRGRIDSCQSDSSVSTTGSTETYHSVQGDHKSSPATSTLRPRSGKEYQRVDRKKLLDVPLSGDSVRTTPHSPITPSVANSSVFNFDLNSMGSHASFMSVCSSGDDSPKYPHVVGMTTRHHAAAAAVMRSEPHTYVNLTFPKNESPRFMDTPPASPRCISKIPELANPQLNYAEIDLSDTDTSKKTRKPKREGAIEYAMIDMVATAAASKVGREHAKHREDSLRRKDNLRRSESDARDIVRGGKERRSLMSPANGSKRERVSLMRSASTASARDRKLSSSSYN